MCEGRARQTILVDGTLFAPSPADARPRTESESHAPVRRGAGAVAEVSAHPRKAATTAGAAWRSRASRESRRVRKPSHRETEAARVLRNRRAPDAALLRTRRADAGTD